MNNLLKNFILSKDLDNEIFTIKENEYVKLLEKHIQLITMSRFIWLKQNNTELLTELIDMIERGCC